MYEELLREAEREGVEVISWSLKGKTKSRLERREVCVQTFAKYSTSFS